MVGTLSIILGTSMLIGTALALPLTSADTTQADNLTASEVQYTITNACKDQASYMLKEAGNKIADEDIADYYQQLCDGYGLDEQSSEIANQEPPAVTNIIPVENINRTALSSMLEVAGSDIHDKDIAEFYYQFLDKAGWEIESEE